MPITAGVFSPVWQWITDQLSYPNMLASRFDTYMNDQATAINTARFKDGSNSPTANLPMAGYRHTGASNAVARDQYLTMGQFQDEGGIYYADTGVANAYIITPSPAITAYAAGQSFKVKITNANTTTSTINVSGLGVKTIVKSSSTALASGDLVAGKIYAMTYDGTNFQVSDILNSVFSDANFRVTGSSDATKLVAIEADGLTTGTTRTWTAQDVSGTVYVSGGTDIPVADGGTGASTAATGFDNLKQQSTTTYTGVVELATAAEVQTATDTSRVPSVSVMGNHPGAAKAWVRFTTTGTIVSSYNVTSVTKNGTGDYTLNFTNALADANYCPTGWAITSLGTAFIIFAGNTTVSLTTTTARIIFSNSTNGSPIDPVTGVVVVHGN